ncbi:YopX family protein [Fructobacillus cardui]|uniref:YopX family protein n=1 Tax=Fructobacillus cardui TaxID=2893170 RepID=UPI00200AA597|nr:YopX family protein [Fructobacillus cardui]MCK8626679.1 YopX family protein [Fructobacillus cardui]
MREIKFRAWHKPFKKTKFGSEFVYGAKAFDFWIMSPDDYTLEQYAGLHDKNGKEIYEGDIVKVYGFSKVTVGKVIYEDYYFTLDGFCDTGTDRPEMAFSEGEFEVNYEVIGNIHENPELLEKKL